MGNCRDRKPRDKVHFRWASNSAGRNVSKARAGPERKLVDADRPFVPGRPARFGNPWRGKAPIANRHVPKRSTGVVSTACGEGNRVTGGSPEPVQETATQPIGRRLAWASERVIVARKPG